MEKQKDFFQRKEQNFNEFDPSNLEDDFAACGLDHDSFKEKYFTLFTAFELDESENIMVGLTKRIIDKLSHRELAFLVAKTIAEDIREQISEEENNNTE